MVGEGRGGSVLVFVTHQCPAKHSQAKQAVWFHHVVMCSKLQELSDAIGPIPAMVLGAFFEASESVYVPEHYQPGHILERILGEHAFLRLIASYGGETLSLPAMRFDAERRMGLVYRLSRRGLNRHEIAELTGLCWQRIKQIEASISSGKPLTQIARQS